MNKFQCRRHQLKIWIYFHENAWSTKCGGFCEKKRLFNICMTHSRFWTPRQIELLLLHYPDKSCSEVAQIVGKSLSSCYQKAIALKIKKTDEFWASDKSKRIQRSKQLPSMIATQFKPGLIPWNAGKKGWSPPGCSETRFKSGSVPANRREVGEIRENSDGTTSIKVAQGGRQWKPLHHYVWFLEHGEYPPKGHVLRFKDGNPKNTALENLQLLTLQENMKLNSIYSKYPPELARLAVLRGALNRQIKKHEQEQS